jgi:hypothetical protein
MKKIRIIDSSTIIMDSIKCSGIFFIDSEENNIKIKHLKYRKSEVKLLFDEDRVFVFKYSKIHSVLSKELYEQAKKIISVWYDRIEEVWATDKKDNPIIFISRPMGIIVAPRISSEDTDFIKEKKK